METILLILVAVALVANTLYLWGELRDMHRRLIDIQIDVVDLRARVITLQLDVAETHALLCDMAMEDAGDAADALWEWDATETNGVGHG